jgi:heme-degrading monooxygenase HmoA
MPETRIAFKHSIPPGEEDAFVLAWGRCKLHTVGVAEGLQEAVLLQNPDAPGEFVTLTTWESLEAWQTYWNHGVPDPEGDVKKNERWVEVKAVRARGGA